MANTLISIGIFLTRYVTIPILVIFIFFTVKYMWIGFSTAYIFYKENGRFMNYRERLEWLARNKNKK